MVGNRLKLLREEADMGQQDLCNLLNIEQSTLANYENNRRTPKLDILLKIAKCLNVSTDYLLGLTNQKAPYGKSVPTINDGETQKSIAFWLSKTGLGSDEAAEKLGISEELLEDYCSGENMPLNILIELSKVCNVSTDCLLGLRDKTRPEQGGELPFHFDPEISRRLKDQARQMDESYEVIADLLGIEEKEVFNFFEYGFVPHLSVFVKIVEHFLVSSDYLLNRTGSTMTVQPGEERLLKAYRALNEDSQTIALSEMIKLGREEALVAAKAELRQGKSYPSNGTEG